MAEAHHSLAILNTQFISVTDLHCDKDLCNFTLQNSIPIQLFPLSLFLRLPTATILPAVSMNSVTPGPSRQQNHTALTYVSDLSDFSRCPTVHGCKIWQGFFFLLKIALYIILFTDSCVSGQYVFFLSLGYFQECLSEHGCANIFWRCCRLYQELSYSIGFFSALLNVSYNV